MNQPGMAAGDLDADELLPLALQAMEENRDAEAISLLKRAVALTPEDGRLQYLLGAMHAQLGLYERAIEELQAAVELAPEIDMAHFQLGLLHLTSGAIAPAEQAWQPLQHLPEEHPLRLFVAGMTALIGERYDQSIALLQAGIAANPGQTALNRDMQRVIETALGAQKEAAEAAAAESPVAQAPSQHVLLSGYGVPARGEGANSQ